MLKKKYLFEGDQRIKKNIEQIDDQNLFQRKNQKISFSTDEKMLTNAKIIIRSESHLFYTDETILIFRLPEN